MTTIILTLVGCGSEDTSNPPDPQPGQEMPIAFSGSLSDEATGSITRTGSTGAEAAAKLNNTFTVWAFKNKGSDKQTVMNGYTVNWTANTAYTTTSNTHNWEYVGQGTDQTIKYWDWGATAYRYFGYTGNKNDADVQNSNVTLTISNIDADDPSTTPYYSHLWYSTPADDLFGKAVTLEFLQPIARVRIIFIFVQELVDSNVDRDALSDVSFRPTDSSKSIANQGKVTISYPLAGTETKESWSSEPTGFFDKIVNDSYQDESSNWIDNWYNVLPRVSQGTYTLSVVVGGGEPKTCVVPAEYMTWTPGYEYTYTFKVMDTGGITLDNIQVGINDWHMVEQITHPIHNW